MTKQDLRSYVDQFDKAYPGEFIRVSDRVSSSFDITAITLELERRRKFPLLLFEDVEGHPIPVLCNLYASRRNYALALATDVASMPTVYSQRLQQFHEPVVVEDPLFRHTVLLGDDVNLDRLPLLTHYPGDAGRYITSGLLVAKDPETGVHTMGYHRLQVKGPSKMGVSLHSRRRMYEYHRRAEERGENLPCSIALGLHPIVGMGALSYPPAGVSKFDVVGGLFQEPMEIAAGETNDVMVPAWAEIVIEGEILGKEREQEGPFGEFTGYFSHRGTNNLFLVKSILMRERPWYHSIVPGRAHDDILSTAVLREAELLKAMRRIIPNVKAVHVPMSGCAAFTAFVSIRQTRAGEAKQAIPIVFGVDHYVKLVVIVDEDVDVFDESDVLWAMTTRMQADRDVHILSGAMGAILDPSATPEGLTAKIGIDATKPFGQEFATRLEMSAERNSWARDFVERLTQSR
jgi:UbiD family decarboxylase